MHVGLVQSVMSGKDSILSCCTLTYVWLLMQEVWLACCKIPFVCGETSSSSPTRSETSPYRTGGRRRGPKPGIYVYMYTIHICMYSTYVYVYKTVYIQGDPGGPSQIVSRALRGRQRRDRVPWATLEVSIWKNGPRLWSLEVQRAF